MYSSNNSLNENNLITFSSFESNSTNSSKDENNSLFPSSFFQLPDEFPFQDTHQFFHQHQDDVDHDFQLHLPPTPHHPVVMNNNRTDYPDQPLIKTDKRVNNFQGAAPGEQIYQVLQIQKRKKYGGSKRDRHSKIKTAKGLRDRRMRLSLEVAKRFFGLQDMLGFEKASKTVEWLLNQSKSKIEDIAMKKNLPNHFSTKSSSSTSECEEGISSLDNNEVGNQEEELQKVVILKKRRNSSKGSTNRVCRKSAFNSISREKARERARERTRMKASNNQGGTKTNFNCWNPFENVEGTHQSQNLNHQNYSFHECEEIRRSQKSKEHSQLHEDNSLFIMSKWSPTMMFNSFNNLQENKFEEFNQSMEKSWEGYNNSI